MLKVQNLNIDFATLIRATCTTFINNNSLQPPVVKQLEINKTLKKKRKLREVDPNFWIWSKLDF